MSKRMSTASALLEFAGIKAETPKQASNPRLQQDIPNIDPKLQALVGDPNRGGISMFSQTSPEVGEGLLANPLSPTEGDDIFFTGLMPGSRFQSRDGQWWDILEYEWEGKVLIQNTWRPMLQAAVSVQDVRRSIYCWLEPFTQVVPDPPAGVDYGVIETRSVK
jgi:hypothetical protein